MITMSIDKTLTKQGVRLGNAHIFNLNFYQNEQRNQNQNQTFK